LKMNLNYRKRNTNDKNIFFLYKMKSSSDILKSKIYEAVDDWMNDNTDKIIKLLKNNPGPEYTNLINEIISSGLTYLKMTPGIRLAFLNDPRFNPNNKGLFYLTYQKRYANELDAILSNPKFNSSIIDIKELVHLDREYPNYVYPLMYDEDRDFFEVLAKHPLTASRLIYDYHHYGDKFLKKILKYDIPRSLIYSKFCSKSPTSKLPPKDLLMLAEQLKIKYDINNLDWKELCGKIGMILDIILD